MSRSKIFSAIDIGTTKITTIIAQHFLEEDQINVIGVANSEVDGIRKGQIVDIEKATESITKSVEVAERMAGCSVSNALVSITAPHLTSLNSLGVVAVGNPQGEIVKDDVDRVIEAARAVSLPSSVEIIHVVPREFRVDGQEGILDPVGMSGVRLEVEAHIVTAFLPALKNLSRCISEVGVNPEAIIYSGFAAAEAVLTETEKELGVILVDVGGSVTSLTIYIDGFPSFVRILPVGAKNVTNDLAIGLRLSLENAEKLKLYLSKGNQSENKDDAEGNKVKKSKNTVEVNEDDIDLKKAGIFEEERRKISRLSTVDGIIKPRLDEIFSFIKNEVRDSGFGGATPAGLVLTGGGSQIIGIKKSSQKVLGLPVRIGFPKEINGLVDEIMTPAYASSLGLLSYAIKSHPGVISSGKNRSVSDWRQKFHFSGIIQNIVGRVKQLIP